MAWGNAIDKISGMIDGIFGLSPEQRKVKLRNKIDKLEAEKIAILKEPPTLDRTRRCVDINNSLRLLRKELGNN